MQPTLSKRGKQVVASGALFVTVGAAIGSSPLVLLGAAVLVALMSTYLQFFTTAILLRRRKIELSWWVPPGEQPGGALSVERPFQVHLALRNHGARDLNVVSIELLRTRGLETPANLTALMPAGQQVEIIGEARAHRAGYHVLHGAVLAFADRLGLFDVRAYFPNPIAIKVFPHQSAARADSSARPVGSLHERVGPHQLRRRGLAGEIREIREHSHGDPFKYIAWKATARRQRLMVRDLETEIVVTHQILIDMAGTMRTGVPGHTRLDYALSAATAMAKSAVDNGDRVGLVSFDSRAYSELRPADGHHHYLRLLDRLIELHSVVDEDLTALTNGELVAAVADYLAHQEAIDVRIRRAPPIDDPAWERIQAGPDGDLFHLDSLKRVVKRLLKNMRQASAHKSIALSWLWSPVEIGRDSEKLMATLRTFCRVRGIELPYAVEHKRGARAAGLEDALGRLHGASRADLVLVITDLLGLLEAPAVSTRALALARRRGQQLVMLVPAGPGFVPEADNEAAASVLTAFTLDEQERIERARRLLLGHGIPVIAAGPEISPLELLGRIQRARQSMRRVA